MFPDFADKIGCYIGKELQKDLIECDFSTTTATTKIVGNIALMDCVKHYFQYEIFCGCEIPEIQVIGGSDWERMLVKVKELVKKFGKEGVTKEIIGEGRV